MPNLVKQRYIVENKEQTRVIDSNEKIVQLIGQAGQEGFSPGLFAQQVDVLSDEENRGEPVTGIEALVADQGSDAWTEASTDGTPEELSAVEQDELIRQQAEEILQQANAQADEMLEEARQESESIKQQAYELGMQQAQEEIAGLKRLQQEELRAALQQQQSEYQQQLNEMEPELTDVILSVIQEVLHVEIEDYRSVILDLVIQTMMQAENPKELSVFANDKNCAYIKEHSDLLRSVAGEETKLDILVNQQLSDAECRIETEFGIYDCGFDVQLKNLSNRIRLLSHQKE